MQFVLIAFENELRFGKLLFVFVCKSQRFVINVI